MAFTPVNQDNTVLAGVGPRLGALLIDGLIVGIGAFIIGLVAGSIVGGIIAAIVAAGGGDTSGAATGGVIVYVIFSIVIGIGYYMWGYGSGQTLACRLLNLRIVNEEGGGPPGYGKALGRYLAQILSGLPFYLGYFWALWDPKK